jgi:hypothetical protein
MFEIRCTLTYSHLNAHYSTYFIANVKDNKLNLVHLMSEYLGQIGSKITDGCTVLILIVLSEGKFRRRWYE